MVRWVVGSILHGVDPLSYFSFQPVLHDWCNKGRGMCYPVCGMVYIKEPLLLIDKSSLCGGSGFPFSLSEWSLTICLTPYNRRLNVLSASLNKTFLSLSLFIIIIIIIIIITIIIIIIIIFCCCKSLSAFGSTQIDKEYYVLFLVYISLLMSNISIYYYLSSS